MKPIKGFVFCLLRYPCMYHYFDLVYVVTLSLLVSLNYRCLCCYVTFEGFTNYLCMCSSIIFVIAAALPLHLMLHYVCMCYYISLVYFGILTLYILLH